MNQQEAIEAAKALPWAKWVAMDGDGCWYAFEAKPALEGDEWFRPIVGRGYSGKAAFLGESGYSVVLIEVPR